MKLFLIMIYAIPAIAITAISAIVKVPILVSIAALLLAALPIVVTSVLIGFTIKKNRGVAPIVALMLVYWVFFGSVAVTNWPFRLLFFISRSSIERAANQVQAGNPPKTPFRVGLFRIEKAELKSKGVVCLWTDPDPGGDKGFVRHEGEIVPLNLFTCIDLDRRWKYVEED
jgi:hypothetical protein